MQSLSSQLGSHLNDLQGVPSSYTGDMGICRGQHRQEVGSNYKSESAIIADIAQAGVYRLPVDICLVLRWNSFVSHKRLLAIDVDADPPVYWRSSAHRDRHRSRGGCGYASGKRQISWNLQPHKYLWARL